MTATRHRQKRRIQIARSALAGLLLLAITACDSARSPESAVTIDPATVTISIVGTNDVHGALLGADHFGGMELLGGYLNNLRDARAADGGAVLLIDAGDMWQGTLESNLTEGASVVAAFNALGYTAAAYGNHEFDFGPVGPRSTPETPADDPQGVMKLRASEADFPIVAANLVDLETGEPIAWPNVHPSVIVEAAGIKVGIIGLLTAEAFQSTISANTRGLRVDPLADTVREQAALLRADGAQLVIVTAHAGSRCDEFDDPYDLSSCISQGEIFRVANALPEGLVDVIVAGHTHQGIAHFVNGIAVSSAYSRNRAFGRIDVQIDTTNGSIVSRRIYPPQLLCRYQSPPKQVCVESTDTDSPPPPAIYEGQPVTPDAAVAEAIAPAIANFEDVKMARVGIRLDTPFQRTTIPESSIGNLLTDALLASAESADFAIHNTRGGIRADLPAGDLIYGNLYEMFPFDNRLVTIKLTGAELRSVLKNQMQSAYWRAGISGGQVIAQCDGSDLKIRVVRNSGAEVSDDEDLEIATADFLATGGDAVFTEVIPPDGFPVPDDAPQIRDVLEDWLRGLGGSIRADMFFDENNRRWVYDTRPPIDCGNE